MRVIKKEYILSEDDLAYIDELIRIREDCIRICEVLATVYITINPYEAERIWWKHNEHAATSRWTDLPDSDDDIISKLTEYDWVQNTTWIQEGNKHIQIFTRKEKPDSD